MKHLLPVLFLLFTVSAWPQNTWQAVNPPGNHTTRAINAQKAGILFVAASEVGGTSAVYRSYDQGSSWNKLELDQSNPYILVFTIACSQEGVLFVGANGTIYRSANDGSSFDKVYSGGDNILNINFSPSGEVYAVGWTNILRSPDNGVTWDTLFCSGTNQFFADIDFGLNGEIYVASGVYEDTGSGFYRSLDHGSTWENIGITESFLYAVKVNNEGVIMAGGLAGLQTSADGGLTWNSVFGSAVKTLESDTRGNVFAGSDDWAGGFWFSDTWGDSWISLVDTILNPFVNQVSISSDNTVYLQSQYSNSYRQQLFRSVNPIVGVNSRLDSPGIELFPNPATEIVSVINIAPGRIARYTVYSLQGQILLSGQLSENTLDISRLLPGVYMIEFDLKNSKTRKKLLVQ